MSILFIAFFTIMASGANEPGSVVVWGGASVYSYSPPEPNKDFVYISATSGSCLGLKADCSIKAWPTDLYMINELSESDTGFTAIDGGWDHVLALTPDGSIMAWGDNVSGQCDVPSPNSGFIEVSAGVHSMGLRNDGSIIVWGQSIFLWDLLDVPEPNSGFISISAGYFYCLGLKDNGSIVAWGWGMNGECDVPAPNSEFIAIDAGPNHCLGLKSDGSIIAWGMNNEGQCDVPAPNTGFVAIATGEFHSLGLKADGSIVAWGFNGFGQCDVPSPNSGFTAIAAGNLFSMGLKNQVTQTGSLQVTIEPQEAVEAGAQWRRAGTTTWNDSGYIETDIPAGECTIEFKNLPGYLTANQQTGTIQAQDQLNLVGSYLYVGTATLSVETMPVASEIFIDGQSKGLAPWIGIVSPGHHTISFGPIASYLTPSDQVVTLTDSESNICVATYIPSNEYGTIKVTTNLEEATYTIVGPATFYGSGRMYSKKNVPSGYYIIYFDNVGYYESPEPENNILEYDQTITFDGTYIRLAGLHVTTIPKGLDPNIYINGEFMGKGEWSDMVPVSETPGVGNYTVSFGECQDYIKPSDREVTIGYEHSNEFMHIVGTYVPLPGTISVLTNLEQAVYYVKFPDGVTHYGQGMHTIFTKCPVGEYAVVFEDVENYITPDLQTMTMSPGGTIVFTATYLVQPEQLNNLLPNVPFYAQYSTNWCWACCASMLLKYYNCVPDKPWEIAANPEFRKKPHETINPLEFATMESFLQEHTSIGWHSYLYSVGPNTNVESNLKEDVVSAIQDGKPVCFGTVIIDDHGRLDSSFHGHVLLIVGADEDSLWIHNPGLISSAGTFSEVGPYRRILWEELLLRTPVYRILLVPDKSPESSYQCLTFNTFGNTIELFESQVEPNKYLHLCWDGSESHIHGYVFAHIDSGLGIPNDGEFIQWDLAQPAPPAKTDSVFFQYPTQKFNLTGGLLEVYNSAEIQKDYLIQATICDDRNTVKYEFGILAEGQVQKHGQTVTTMNFGDNASLPLSDLAIGEYTLNLFLIDKGTMQGNDYLSIPFKVGPDSVTTHQLNSR